MNFQMTKYLFKYMQNAFLTKDPAFMKNWDIYTPCFSEDNYFLRSVKKQLLSDTETLLYACYSLPPHAMKGLLRDSSFQAAHNDEAFYPKFEVLDLIRQNMTRLLNFSNVQATAALKNLNSIMGNSVLKKLYKEAFSYLNWENDTKKRVRSRSRGRKRSESDFDPDQGESRYEHYLAKKKAKLKQLLAYDSGL